MRLTEPTKGYRKQIKDTRTWMKEITISENMFFSLHKLKCIVAKDAEKAEGGGGGGGGIFKSFLKKTLLRVHNSWKSQCVDFGHTVNITV